MFVSCLKLRNSSYSVSKYRRIITVGSFAGGGVINMFHEWSKYSVTSLMAALAVIAFTLSPASARVILKEKTTYYTVKGSTGKEIFESMLENGPKIEGRMGHFLATTDLDYEIRNYQLELVGTRCIPKSFDLVVHAKYTYPKWRGSSRAKKETRAAWNHFIKETRWHEKQHVKIAMDIAHDMAKVLTDVKGRGARKCKDISWKLGLKARRLGSKHSRKQRQFDRRDLSRGGRGYKAQLQLLKAK